MEWSSLISSAGSGLNFWEGWGSSKTRREEAKLKGMSIARQLELLGQEEELIGTAYGQRKEVATDIYGNKIGSLASKVGFQMGGIRRGADIGTSRSGLGYSGTIETERERGLGRTRTEGEFGMQSLREKLGQELMELDIWKASELGRIESEKVGLEAELDIYGEIGKEDYMGIPDWIWKSIFWGQTLDEGF